MGLTAYLSILFFPHTLGSHLRLPPYTWTTSTLFSTTRICLCESPTRYSSLCVPIGIIFPIVCAFYAYLLVYTEYRHWLNHSFVGSLLVLCMYLGISFHARSLAMVRFTMERYTRSPAWRAFLHFVSCLHDRFASLGSQWWCHELSPGSW